MLSIYSDEYQKAVLYGQYIPDFIVLFFPGMCVITTAACGYTEKNATGNVLLLFLLLILAHRNTLTSITALLFLFCCALYAPVGMTYGKSTTVLLSRCCRPRRMRLRSLPGWFLFIIFWSVPRFWCSWLFSGGHTTVVNVTRWLCCYSYYAL